MENKQLPKNFFGNNPLGNKKEKVVETKQFQIRGHLLRWDDVVIQISSISQISIGSFQTQPFPIWAAAIALIGIVALKAVWFVGLLLIAIGALSIYVWYKETQKTKGYKYLHIHLNSGGIFSLLFEEEWFLREVLNVFANIFEDGGKSTNTNISVDIKNCKVDHQSTLIGSLSAMKD